MRYLLAVALAALVGCAGSKDTKFVYRDQRSVTTRPAPASGKPADILVRVEKYQGVPGLVIPPSVPANAKLIASAEALASYGTPFYCTVFLPERRVELGGLAMVPSQDKHVKLNISFAENLPGGVSSITATYMFALGETRIIGGCPDGSVTTLTLQALAK